MTRSRRDLAYLIGTAGFLLMVGLCSVCYTFEVDNEVRLARSRSRLAAMSLAIQSYYQENGKSPPIILRDQKGQPLHSWRMLLLPYLLSEGKDWISQCDLAQPWNSPHNMQVFVHAPQSLSRQFSNTKGHDNRFTMVVAVTTSQVPDGQLAVKTPSKYRTSVAVIDLDQTNIPWYEPRDFDTDSEESERILAERGFQVLTTTGQIGLWNKNKLTFDGSPQSLFDAWFRRNNENK